jgi:hypothetical protein
MVESGESHLYDLMAAFLVNRLALHSNPKVSFLFSFPPKFFKTFLCLSGRPLTKMTATSNDDRSAAIKNHKILSESHRVDLIEPINESVSHVTGPFIDNVLVGKYEKWRLYFKKTLHRRPPTDTTVASHHAIAASFAHTNLP